MKPLEGLTKAVGPLFKLTLNEPVTFVLLQEWIYISTCLSFAGNMIHGSE